MGEIISDNPVQLSWPDHKVTGCWSHQSGLVRESVLDAFRVTFDRWGQVPATRSFAHEGIQVYNQEYKKMYLSGTLPLFTVSGTCNYPLKADNGMRVS